MKSILVVACAFISLTFSNVFATSLERDNSKDTTESKKPVTPEDLLQYTDEPGAMLDNALMIRSKQTVPLASLDGASFSYYGAIEHAVEYTHDTVLNNGDKVSAPGFYIVGSVEVDETGRYSVPQQPKHLRKNFLYLYSSIDNRSLQFDKKANAEVVEFFQEKAASTEELKSYAKGNHLELDCYMDCPQSKDTQFSEKQQTPKQPLISYVFDISTVTTPSVTKSPVDLPHEVSEGEELIQVSTAPMVIAGTTIDSESAVWTQDVSFVWTKTVVKLPLIAAAPTSETSSNEDKEHLYPYATI